LAAHAARQRTAYALITALLLAARAACQRANAATRLRPLLFEDLWILPLVPGGYPEGFGDLPGCFKYLIYLAPRAGPPQANRTSHLDCQTGLTTTIGAKGVSGVVANRPSAIFDLCRQRSELIEQLSRIEVDLAHADAAQAARARERAMTTAAARARVFRDGTPRDTPAHKEIARRYAWQASKHGKSLPRPKLGQTGTSKLITLIRMSELERLFSLRWGRFLPNDQAGYQAATVAAHHIVHAGADAERHIVSWLALWAPWMSAPEAEAIAAVAIAAPVKFTADTLGWRLGLTGDERHELGITTIGAVGISKDQRTRFRKIKRAFAARACRRQKGAQLRGLYEAHSATRRQPWVQLGISRSTWYRRGRPDPSKVRSSPPKNGLARVTDDIETSPRPAGSADIADHAPVSTARCGPDPAVRWSPLLPAHVGSGPRALRPAGRTQAPTPRSERAGPTGRRCLTRSTNHPSRSA